jgi:hypothetical protein
MKKLAFVFVVLGSGLAAFGFSGWYLTTTTLRTLDGDPAIYDISAGWTPGNRLEITIGVVLLVFGLLLHRDSR